MKKKHAALNIGKRMQKLLPKLMLGPSPGYGAGAVRPVQANRWNENFAMVEGAVFDPRPAGECYFDIERWQCDMMALVLKAFKSSGENAVAVGPHTSIKVTTKIPKKVVFQRWVKPGTIIVCFKPFFSKKKQDQEITVYRAVA